MSIRIATNLFGSSVTPSSTYDFPSKTVSIGQLEPTFLNVSGDNLEGDISLADNKLYFDTEKTQYIENDGNDDVILNIKKLKIQDGNNTFLQYDTGNIFVGFNNKILRNVQDPVLDQDVVTKKYLNNNSSGNNNASLLTIGTLSDDRLSTNIVTKTYLDAKLLPTEMFLDYNFIINNYNPKFFISAHYWNGLQFQDDPPQPVTFIQDLSGNGLTTNSTITLGLDINSKYGFNLDGTNNIISNSTFSTHYTFFWIGQKYDNNGRLFASLEHNSLAFYWMKKKACFYIENDGELNQYDDTFSKNFFVFRNSNGLKTMWELENNVFVKKHTDSTTGGNSFGRVVVGATVVAPNEFGSGLCNMTCCFDVALSDADVTLIGNKLAKYL